MKIYSVGNTLMLLVSLLFLGGSPLFAAQEVNIGKLEKKVADLKKEVAITEQALKTDPDNEDTQEELLAAQGDLAAAQKELDAAQAGSKRKAEIAARRAARAAQTTQAEQSQPIPAQPKGDALPVKPKGVKQEPMNSEKVKKAVRDAGIRELQALEKKAKETGEGWVRLSNRAGFFIQEANKVGDTAFEKEAKAVKERADKLLPRTLSTDLSRAATYATAPVKNVLSKGAGIAGAAAQKAAGGISSVWHYFAGPSNEI